MNKEWSEKTGKCSPYGFVWVYIVSAETAKLIREKQGKENRTKRDNPGGGTIIVAEFAYMTYVYFCGNPFQ